MKAKTFFITALSCTLLLLAGSAGLVAWVDPLLTARTLGEGETALFVNERYEMAGLIRRQDYSNILMGTSLAANYRASWFTEGTGEKTLKITFPDGRLSEFDTALDLAFRTHGELSRVFFCLDPNLLIRPDQGSELPEYLYNDNPVDDVQLYFNAESLALAVKSLILGEEAKTSLDEAYIWEGNTQFSIGDALAGYPRPEPSGTVLPDDAYLATAEQSMDVVCGWARAHPDTQFIIWYPPYSVLYWDQADRLGQTEAILHALEYACGRLLACENVRLSSFLNAQGTITDLNQYADHIHCSTLVTRYEAEQVLAGEWTIWPQFYQKQIDELRQFVTSYDYDGLFARYGWADGAPSSAQAALPTEPALLGFSGAPFAMEGLAYDRSVQNQKFFHYRTH